MRPAFVWHPSYEVDIGRHVFPTQKFRMMKELLVSRGAVREDEVLASPPATDEELLRVLTPHYLEDMRTYRHTRRTLRSELPITRDIIESMVRTAGGTILCARKALEVGAACHFGGGFHHGFADRAEGFCYINDVAIAARAMQAERGIRRVAIVDTDVHQGNGTASIFAGDNDVFTLSIHEERLYPWPKVDHSDLDMNLPAMCGQSFYLDELARGLDQAIDGFRPELLIFVTGADPFENDQLGNLGLTWETMRRRDQLVIEACTSRSIPFATVVAGGYSRDVNDTVGIHAQTVEVAIAAAEKL